jgi:hypothetical protein
MSPQAGVVHSGINYQPAELGRQVAAALTRYRPVNAGQATPPGGARPSATLPGLPRCVTSVVAGQRLIFADVAKYQGQPAVVFVVPGQAGAQRVLVAAADCSGTEGRLLASTTLPR